jgi:hypothetical protein
VEHALQLDQALVSGSAVVAVELDQVDDGLAGRERLGDDDALLRLAGLVVQPRGLGVRVVLVRAA